MMWVLLGAAVIPVRMADQRAVRTNVQAPSSPVAPVQQHVALPITPAVTTGQGLAALAKEPVGISKLTVYTAADGHALLTWHTDQLYPIQVLVGVTPELGQLADSSQIRSELLPNGGYQHAINIAISQEHALFYQVNALAAQGDAVLFRSPVQATGLAPRPSARDRAARRTPTAAGTSSSSGSAQATSMPPGTVWGWGENGSGQLGDGTTINRTTPVQMIGLTGVTDIKGGFFHSLALKQDGTVWAAGWNDGGQLGDGTTTNRSTPVQVIGLTGVTAIARGFYHSLALKQDGTVWSWGENRSGQLGDGTTINRTTPVQVTGLTGVMAIAGGSGVSLAVKTDGTVWAWGGNDRGQLGDGTTINRSTPVQVASLTDVTSVESGEWHSVALKRDGTVWAWGRNDWSQLGDGTTVNRTTPVQVTSLTDVMAIAAGSYHSVALKSDGTVWAWGDNGSGQLGDGTTTSRSSPVQVTALTGVTAVAAGAWYSFALKSDGTGWAWGDNDWSELGDGTATDRSIPVLINVINGVTKLVGGKQYTLALTCPQSSPALSSSGTPPFGITPGPVSAPTAGQGVSLADGDFGDRVPLLSLGGKGLPIDFALHYATPRGCAFADLYKTINDGWTHAYARRLTIASNGNATLLTEDGRSFLYTASSGGFTRPSGSLANLALNGTSYVLTYRDGAQDIFDATGLLTTVKDGFGNQTTLTYVGTKLVTIANPLTGQKLQLSYDTSGATLDKLVAVADDAANSGVVRRVTLGYDAAKRLSAVTDAAGYVVRTVTYDARGRIDKLYDAANNPATVTGAKFTQNSYDAATGQITRQVLLDGAALDFNWNTASPDYDLQVTYNTGSINAAFPARIVRYLHDTKRNLTRVYNAVNASETALPPYTAYTYNANNQSTTVTDPKGKTISFTLDLATGDLVSITDALNNQTAMEYNAKGRQTKLVEPEGGVYRTTYDSTGTLPVAETDPLGHITSYSYNAQGQLTATVEPNGIVNTQAYDGRGYPTSSVGDAPAPVGVGTLLSQGKLASAATVAIGNEASKANDGDPATRWQAGSVSFPQAWTVDLGANYSLNRVVIDWTTDSTTYNYTLAASLDNVSFTTVVDKAGNATAGDTTDTFTAVVARYLRVTVTGASSGAAAANEIQVSGTSGGLSSGGTQPSYLAINSSEVSSANSWVTETTNEQGIKTTYGAFNANGWPAETIFDPTGRAIKTVTEYDALGRVVKETANANATNLSDKPITQYRYDALGRVIKTIDAAGTETTSEYNSFGELIKTIDQLGRTTSYRYDYLLSGTMVVTTDHVGNTNKQEYDTAGRLIKSTNARGIVTSSTYNDAGWLLSQSISYTSTAGGARTDTTTSTYDKNGRLKTIKDPVGQSTGKTTSYTYDIAGRLTDVTYPAGNTIHYDYDQLGRKVLETVGPGTLNEQTQYVYDAVGRQAKVITNPAGLKLTTTSTYTAAGSTDKWNVQRVTDAKGNAVSYNYTSLGQVASVTDALGSTWSFQYDNLGRMTRKMDPQYRITRYSYDALGRQTGQTDTLGKTAAWTYNADGTAATLTDYKGQVMRYSYDGLGRITGIDYQDGGATGNVSYQRDANGNVTLMTDGQGATSYTYDAYDRLDSRTRGGKAITYSRGHDGRVLNVTWAGSSFITNSYDDNGRVATTSQSGVSLSYQYDAANRVTTVMEGGATNRTISYDAAGRLRSISYPNPDGTTTTFSYVLDGNGNRTSMTDPEGLTTYTYDALNRLVKVVYPGVGSETARTVAYTYDSMGNLTASLGDGSAPIGDAPQQAPAGDREFTAMVRLQDGIQTVQPGGTEFPDLNGDGLRDMITLIYVEPGGWWADRPGPYRKAFLNTGSGWVEAPQFVPTEDRIFTAMVRSDKTIAPGSATFPDLNGDGKADLVTLTYVEASSTGWFGDRPGWYRKAFLNTGSGWVEAPQYVPTEDREFTAMVRSDRTVQPGTVRFPDLNGDGKADRITLVYVEASSTGWFADRPGWYRKAYVNNGNGWTDAPQYVSAGDREFTAIVRADRTTFSGATVFPDLNGDRKADMITLYLDAAAGWWGNGGWYRKAFVNTGSGWTDAPQYVPAGDREVTAMIRNVAGVEDVQPGTTRFADLNGDGEDDMITLVFVEPGGWWGYAAGWYRKAFVNTGSGWTDAPQYVPASDRDFTAMVPGGASITPGGTAFLDLNGDRRADRVALVQDADGGWWGNGGWYRKIFLSGRFTLDAADRLTNEGYQYDANGNLLTTADGTSYTWDRANRLKQVTQSNGIVQQYAYDGNGNRVRAKITGGSYGTTGMTTDYFLDETDPLAQVLTEQQSNNVTNLYGRGPTGPTLLQNTTGGSTTKHVLRTDGLGTVRQLGTGVTQSFNVWGSPRASSGAWPTTLGYTGELGDQASSLRYLRARFYDPRLGRFLSQDTVLGDVKRPMSLNLYSYVENNPVNWTDPSGHQVQAAPGNLPWCSPNGPRRFPGTCQSTIQIDRAVRGRVGASRSFDGACDAHIGFDVEATGQDFVTGGDNCIVFNSAEYIRPDSLRLGAPRCPRLIDRLAAAFDDRVASRLTTARNGRGTIVVVAIGRRIQRVGWGGWVRAPGGRWVPTTVGPIDPTREELQGCLRLDYQVGGSPTP
jgi:RHS repeat-associated protein